MSIDRALSFVDAIREATDQEMARDERVLLFGLDVDDPKAIRKKIGAAVTDSGEEVRAAAEKPGISNLIEILAAVQGSDAAAVRREHPGPILRSALLSVVDQEVGY